MQAEGPKHRRTLLKANSIVVNHDEGREQHIAAIIDAVEKKAEKKYPDKSALVVRIDDAGPFREDADVAAVDEMVQQKLVPLLSGREFTVLALEGSQRVHLSYDLNEFLAGTDRSEISGNRSLPGLNLGNLTVEFILLIDSLIFRLLLGLYSGVYVGKLVGNSQAQ